MSTTASTVARLPEIAGASALLEIAPERASKWIALAKGSPLADVSVIADRAAAVSLVVETREEILFADVVSEQPSGLTVDGDIRGLVRARGTLRARALGDPARGAVETVALARGRTQVQVSAPTGARLALRRLRVAPTERFDETGTLVEFAPEDENISFHLEALERLAAVNAALAHTERDPASADRRALAREASQLIRLLGLTAETDERGQRFLCMSGRPFWFSGATAGPLEQ